MEIPRSLLDELTEQVNALSDSAQALASSALDNIFAEWDGADVAGLRAECIEALEAIEATYCDTYAAGKAAEFYDGCRSAQGVGGGYGAIADSRRDPQALAGAVKAMVQYVVVGEGDRYRRECLARIDADVRRSANSCVAYNVRKDPKKPKYARVPSGGETCGFCLMLASFGYHYNSEEAASHAHDGCDCRVVPNFGKASVKDYDPDKMYEHFNDCLSALGGRDGIRAEWNALPREEREAYVASHGHREGDAFQKYVNKRVSQEIETRDPEWFTHSISPSFDVLPGASPSKSEKQTAMRLARHGWKSEFRPTRSSDQKRTSDAFFISGHGKTEQEFKSPSGNGKQTIAHQFEEAAGQSKRLVIDLKDVGDEWSFERAVEEASQKVNREHSIRKGVHKGEKWVFDEVLIISREGEDVRKIKRG